MCLGVAAFVYLDLRVPAGPGGHIVLGVVVLAVFLSLNIIPRSGRLHWLWPRRERGRD